MHPITPEMQARLEQLNNDLLKLYADFTDLRVRILAAAQPLAPAPSVPASAPPGEPQSHAAPDYPGNPIAALRAELSMTRRRFALHLGLSINQIESVEKGIPKKLSRSWEVGLERAGHSFRQLGAAYEEWREAITRQSARKSACDEKVTPFPPAASRGA